MDIGEDARHYGQYQCMIFLVGGKRDSISSIIVDAEKLLFDGPVTALQTDDPPVLISDFHLRDNVGRVSSYSRADRELLTEGPSHV